MKDGRVISTDDTMPPDDFVREIRNRLNTRPSRSREDGPAGDAALGLACLVRTGAPPPRMGGRGGRRGGASGVVLVNGAPAGVVIGDAALGLQTVGSDAGGRRNCAGGDRHDRGCAVNLWTCSRPAAKPRGCGPQSWSAAI